MERQLVTADELRAVMLDQIHRNAELDGDCRECGAPAPVPVDWPDESGCNWTVHQIPACPSECIDAVTRIVDNAKARFNLRN